MPKELIDKDCGNSLFRKNFSVLITHQGSRDIRDDIHNLPTISGRIEKATQLPMSKGKRHPALDEDIIISIKVKYQMNNKIHFFDFLTCRE